MAFGTRSSTGSRLPAFTTLVWIEALLAIGLVGWWIAGGRSGVAALGVAALAAVTLVPMSGGASLATTVLRRLGFHWFRLRRNPGELAPPPFDVPTASHRQRQSPSRARAEDSPIGVRWAGATMITMLRIGPGIGAPTFLSPFGSETAEPHVPLTTLADCIDSFDIPLSSIDVISHGVRVGGAGETAAIYERTLGPLPATTHRSTYVVLRLDPAACPTAVSRRGGGATGALRTATITTRRIARRLRECGLVATPLGATEIDSVTKQLTHGAELGSMHEEWAQVNVGPIRSRSAAIDPHQLQRVLRTPQPAALAATVTLTLSRGHDRELLVRALLRVDDAPDAGRTVRAWPAGVTPLDGLHFDALAASLPCATAHRVRRGLHATSDIEADALLDALQMEVSGCGQLIGADHAGRAVTARLFGPGVSEVSVRGDARLAAQIVLRVVATGGTVAVHTSRPERWQHLVARVGDSRLLSFADPTGGSDADRRIHLFDGVSPRVVTPGATRIVVADLRQTTNDLPAATIELTQNLTQPDRVVLRTPVTSVCVTTVATPEEARFSDPPVQRTRVFPDTTGVPQPV